MAYLIFESKQNLFSLLNYFLIYFLYIQDGATSLYAAAREGHRAVVQVLLDHGANVNVLREVHIFWGRLIFEDCSFSILVYFSYSLSLFKDGATPLYVAAREGRKEVVRVLLEGGANVGVSRKVLFIIFLWYFHFDIDRFLNYFLIH